MSKRDERFDSKTMTQNVGLKGLDSMDIFHEDADRENFIYALEKACEKYEVKLLVYTLMDNHVHLILGGEIEKFQHVFESIGARYARSFNLKYGRSGPFFNQRYYNGRINSRKQFLHTASYMFNNPVKAGIVKSPKEYKWSNFMDLLQGSACEGTIEAIDELVNLKNMLAFTLMMTKKETPSKLQEFLEMMGLTRITDQRAKEIATKIVGNRNIGKISKIKEKKRRCVVEQLWKEGSCIPQIVRVTGISNFKVVQYIGEIK